MSTKSIWEKISILTSFLGGAAAFIVALAGVFAVSEESKKGDVSPQTSITSSQEFISKAPQNQIKIKKSAIGWAYIGQTKFNLNLSIGDNYSFDKNTNIRSDYPRFPLYRFAPVLNIVPAGTESKIKDIRKYIGTGDYTWIYVEATWEVGSGIK